jgi:hypothetical protein
MQCYTDRAVRVLPALTLCGRAAESSTEQCRRLQCRRLQRRLWQPCVHVPCRLPGLPAPCTNRADRVGSAAVLHHAVRAGGAYIELVPYRYLFKVTSGQYCLGVFDNGVQGTLLGGIITRNVLVKVCGSVGVWVCGLVWLRRLGQKRGCRGLGVVGFCGTLLCFTL